MRTTLCVALLLIALAGACSQGRNQAASTSAAAADTLTERQRDSILAASKVPGAKAVGKALEAADAQAAHTAAIDSANAEVER